MLAMLLWLGLLGVVLNGLLQRLERRLFADRGDVRTEAPP